MTGIEPIKELREIGYSNGLSEADIVDGDGTRLDYAAYSFDLVCEFGVLHHLRNPDKAVSEMTRVASNAIFISDTNNFGQGSYIKRSAKRIINFLGLCRVADLLKTRGTGFSVSDGDGVAYSYSVLRDYKQILNQCTIVHLLNSRASGCNLYRSTGHVALLGMKK